MIMKITCGFTIPITLYGLPPRIDDVMKAMRQIKEAGFDTMEMEIDASDYDDYKEKWPEVIALSKELDLRVVSIMAVTYDIFSLNVEKRRKTIDHYETICKMTKDIGAELSTNCLYLPNEMVPNNRESYYVGGPTKSVKVPEGFKWEDLRKSVISQLQKSSDIATKYGLQFAIEMRAGDFISSVDGTIALFKDTERENIGMVYDVAHAHAISEYLDLGIYKLDKYLKLIHLSDNDGTRPFHYQPGKGDIDFKNIINTLKKIDYDGYLVVDISGINNIVEEAKKMKGMLEKMINE